MMGNALRAVEELLKYGLHHKLLGQWDIVQARNGLYALLKYGAEEIDEEIFFDSSKSDWEIPETATAILKAITDDYVRRGHLASDTVTARDLFEAAVMGVLMPRQSEIVERFDRRFADSPKEATDDFYRLCRSSSYIHVDRIKKDIYWTADTEFGTLELTVNLSKPEKDPKDIAAAASAPASTYPKCLLCLQNVGFAGNLNWPARQNLRVIPMELDGGNWYLQYSPYAYYNEHCIVFGEHHRAMEINVGTFRQLADFVTKFPHYFMGSNADLPIVGGSILSHEHFQGGRHVFPMEKAPVVKTYKYKKYKDVEVGLVKWPLSVIRLKGTPEDLISTAADILAAWRAYSQGEIISHTGDTPHNTITPIARVRDSLEFDLVLRNNRTTAEHPLGLFHPHSEWHHIKKENIGLIEVMGLAVLPGRLKQEIEAGKLSREEISGVFVNVLKDCGVFKDSNDEDFDKFMKSMGME